MVSALPTGARLRHLYDVEYPVVYSHQEIGQSRREMFMRILDRLEKWRAPGHLLDVGCAGGHLLAEARRRGWRVVATDLSHVACGVARRRAACPAFQADGSALPVGAGRIDAVALLGVVDLTTDPLGVVREAHRVLGPGGLLVIRVTNASFHRPLAKILVRVPRLSRWWGLPPVLHVFAFTAWALRTLVEQIGFRTLEVRNSDLTLQMPSRLLAMGVRSVEMLSGGRGLVAPSIELYARRDPDHAATARPG